MLNAIRHYYDANTRLFLRFGSSTAAQTIHRALWVEGVTTLAQALQAVNGLILEAARPLGEQLRIADLGCGVGATLFSLLEALSAARGVGLTLSPLQAQLGARFAPPQALILEADFSHLPLAFGFDLAYSIEAFVHALDADVYLSEAARLLRPGGRLVLVDDFRGPAYSPWLEVYQRGWQTPNLLTVADLATRAAGQGLRLISSRDLTPELRLRALPDWLARLLLLLFKPFWNLHPIVASMLGSMALQHCLRERAVEYRLFVFERAETPSEG